MADNAAGDAPEALGNTAVFPPPPAIYKQFTERNLAWLDVLMQHKGDADWAALDPDARIDAQRMVLERAVQDTDPELALQIPGIDLERTLQPPRVDWIEEDGGYQLFGQRWPIPDVAPSLEQLGIPRYFPEGPFDRAHVLGKLLRTLLQTYFDLVCDLLQPIRPYDIPVPAPQAPPHAQEGAGENVAANVTWIPSSHLKERMRHMETVLINFQFLLNEMQPTQARTELLSILRQQLTERRQATGHIREKCRAIREEIARLEM